MPCRIGMKKKKGIQSSSAYLRGTCIVSRSILMTAVNKQVRYTLVIRVFTYHISKSHLKHRGGSQSRSVRRTVNHGASPVAQFESP
jgi:hypothetical protein